MAHEVDYTTIKDEYKRREQALKDLKKWLGPTAYKRLSKVACECKAQGETREMMEGSMAMFHGVNGYPVTVWLDFLGFPHQTPNNPVQHAETQAPDLKVG